MPYHQNVYDLLQLEPGECPIAARMIAAHEFECGLLPAAVCEWYQVPNVVLPRADEWSLENEHGTSWHEFSGDDHPVTLDQVLDNFAAIAQEGGPPHVRVISDQQGAVSWFIEVDGSEDPPVWIGTDEEDTTDWEQTAERFSDFVFEWIADTYLESHTPLSENWHGRNDDEFDDLPIKPRFVKVHINGLWLRTPDEPLTAPIIDFLTEQFGEPERIARPGDVTTYTYRPEGGTIRVTADDPAHPDPLSAWWVHADTPERLAEFARLLLPWGTLRDTLRADTAPARDVLHRSHTGASN